MNEGMGLGNWGFEEISSELVTDSKGAQLAISQVKAWLKDIEFHAPAWGQNRVTRGDIGDAKKRRSDRCTEKSLVLFLDRGKGLSWPAR